MGCCSSTTATNDYDPWVYERNKDLIKHSSGECSTALPVPTPTTRIHDFFPSPVGDQVASQRSLAIQEIGRSHYHPQPQKPVATITTIARTSVSPSSSPTQQQQPTSPTSSTLLPLPLATTTTTIVQTIHANNFTNSISDTRHSLNAPQPAPLSPYPSVVKSEQRIQHGNDDGGGGDGDGDGGGGARTKYVPPTTPKATNRITTSSTTTTTNPITPTTVPQPYRSSSPPPPPPPPRLLPVPDITLPTHNYHPPIKEDEEIEDFANLDEYDFTVPPSIHRRVVSISTTYTDDTPISSTSSQNPPPPPPTDASTTTTSTTLTKSPNRQNHNYKSPQPHSNHRNNNIIINKHNNNKKKKHIRLKHHYDLGETLGVGAFAVVLVGIHKASQKRYAIKKIDQSKMFWNDRNALDDEIENLKLVRRGPHIVQLYEVYEERQRQHHRGRPFSTAVAAASFTTSYCFLVMELMQGGELFDRILQKKKFTEREARDVCLCLLRALEYMHERRVTHRDLKPENLLLRSLESDTDLKLADFGFSKHVVKHNGCRTLCGTPGYLAPEVLERWPAYDVKCDLWSVGVILFLLLGGYLPFDDDEEDLVFDNTRNGKYEFIPNLWRHVSPGAKDLVTRLLTINPNKRISASEALQHEWMQKSNDMLQSKELNISKLGTSVRNLKAKGQAQEENRVEANRTEANRVERLNQEFNSYLKKKRCDSLRSIMSNVQPSVVAAPQSRDDSATGLSVWDCYELGEELGEGGFAKVFRATHKTTKVTYAIKDITLSKLEAGGESALQDEIDALKILRGGPHIVRLYDVFVEPDHTYLVMEEMKGGELLMRIIDKEVYTEREARKVCKILFEAVDYMHNKQIAHRDLKPENLLLVEKGDDTSIKIADFGFAKRVTRPNCLKTLCGTPEYVAPEILDLQVEGYDHRADLWSIGVIVFILLGGYPPFQGQLEELAGLIQKGEYEFHDEYWRGISNAAKDLIRSMLQLNPDLRITAEEALRSDWMTIEEEMLTNKDLSATQTTMKKLLPADKLRGMVNAIIASNKLRSLTKEFMGRLGEEDEISERFSRRTSQYSTLATVFECVNSSNNVPFAIVYDWGEQLGAGQFSVVHEAKHKATGVSYAVKRVPRKDLHPSDAVALQDEINALRVVKDCSQIVHLFDVFEEPDYTYLILEKMDGGDLIDRIIVKRHYTEKDAKQVAIKLLQGVEFCHQRRIANRNLKPENIQLLTSGDDTNVKICDFGYAKRVLYPNSLRTQCGTEGYVAPEILEHRPAYDVSCDMWSLGVVLYIVLGGYRPFRGGNDPEDVMRQIRYGEYEFHEKYWCHVSVEAKDLISRLLVVDPMDRITASDALNSSWIQADDATLDQNSLETNLEELKRFKAKAKFRGAVKMIIASKKLQSLGEQYRAFQDF